MANTSQVQTVKFYTNGRLTIKVKPGENIPNGFYLGRTFKSNPWNRGLSKETDERVRQNGNKTRETRRANDSYRNP